MNKIIVHCTSDTGSVPAYETQFSSGADMRANIESPVTIAPGERALIPTGLKIQIPDGYEAQVRPRSGLAAKSGIIVVNTPGTIDSDYRGEIKIILGNFSNQDFTVHNGDRIAQIIFAPVYQAEFVLKEELEDTSRGDGGFGSTGVS